jgi:DNA-binding Lrp family transcriptional regulator
MNRGRRFERLLLGLNVVLLVLVGALALWTLWTVVPKPWRDLDPDAVERSLEAWVAITFTPDTDRDRFLAALEAERAVEDLVHLTGPADYEAVLRCQDTDELDQLLTRLKGEHRLASTHTRIVLQRHTDRRNRIL